MLEYVLSHKSCPDGCASALLVKKIYPQVKIHLLGHNILNDFYEKLINRVALKSTIIIIDICPDEAFLKVSLEKIKEKSLKVKIFDHHQTNAWLKDFTLTESLKPFIEINFSDNFCASYMFWEKYRKKYPQIEEYRDFIKAINDRDLWINQIKEGKMLAKLHQCLEDNKFIERFYHNPSLEFDEKENYALSIELAKENKRSEFLLNKINLKEDINHKKYGVIYGEGNSSDLLNQAIINYNLDYAILINLHSKKGSIRSNGNFDCSKYAEKLGGGGHAKASGFRIKFDYPEF